MSFSKDTVEASSLRNFKDVLATIAQEVQGIMNKEMLAFTTEMSTTFEVKYCVCSLHKCGVPDALCFPDMQIEEVHSTFSTVSFCHLLKGKKINTSRYVDSCTFSMLCSTIMKENS